MVAILIALLLVLIISRTVFSVLISVTRKEKMNYDERMNDESIDNYERRGYERKSNEMKEGEKKLLMINKIASIVICALIGITTIADSIYVIGEQNLAIITTFGKAEAVSGTGMHFKIPFIQKVKKFDSTIQGFAIGYQEEKFEK